MTNKTSSRYLSLLLQFVAVLVIATVFISLGLWQWDRAKQHQELEEELTKIASTEVVEMNSIFEPVKALDGQIANRLVAVEGRYIQFFLAYNQSVSDRSTTNQSTTNQVSEATFQVGLFEVAGSSPGAAILVARQISTSLEGAPRASERVALTARILPTQREDLDPAARGIPERLSRIDSALLVETIQDSSLALYDGFLLLNQETIDGVSSSLTLIPDQIAEPTIPGYYWQHISYVIIWFLMAALILYLPFYQVRRNKLMVSERAREVESQEGMER